jgi:hypothetical protein
MKTYARISGGAIAELLTIEGPIAGLFNPALVWVDVTGQAVQVGWLQQGTGFVAPPAPAATLPTPTLAQLQAQLAALSAQIAALQPQA